MLIKIYFGEIPKGIYIFFFNLKSLISSEANPQVPDLTFVLFGVFPNLHAEFFFQLHVSPLMWIFQLRFYSVVENYLQYIPLNSNLFLLITSIHFLIFKSNGSVKKMQKKRHWASFTYYSNQGCFQDGGISQLQCFSSVAVLLTQGAVFCLFVFVLTKE